MDNHNTSFGSKSQHVNRLRRELRTFNCRLQRQHLPHGIRFNVTTLEAKKAVPFQNDPQSHTAKIQIESQVSTVRKVLDAAMGVFFMAAIFGSCSYVFLRALSATARLSSQELIDFVTTSFGG